MLILAGSIVACVESNKSEVSGLMTAPVPVKPNRIPDQAEIIFLQDAYNIYVMDRRGGNVTQITFERPRQYEHGTAARDPTRPDLSPPELERQSYPVHRDKRQRLRTRCQSDEPASSFNICG